MTKKKQAKPARRIPKVRIARPADRPFQLRYLCPIEGREVRLSTGTRDEQETQQKKAELEAKLLLGIDGKRRKRHARQGLDMPWADFRHEYTRLKLDLSDSDNTVLKAENVLDVVERILRPRSVQTIVDNGAELLAELKAGSGSHESKRQKERSDHTVESYIKTLQAAINWMCSVGWMKDKVSLPTLKTAHLKSFKGRPLLPVEFERVLEACEVVCPHDPNGWKHFLRGLWDSGLRLGEAYGMSWDMQDTIRPLRLKGGLVVLRIPASQQKSRKDEIIPSIPEFASLLGETPADDRTGYVFNPTKRRGQGRYTDLRQVGRVISKIGRAAEVFVTDDGKPASAHDLRRSFGQRMADAGLPPRDLQAIMRHSSMATTEKYYLTNRASDQAERIAKYLGTHQTINEKRTADESPQVLS